MIKEIITLNVRHWVLAIMVLLSNGVVAAAPGWVSLFDGKTLNGWVQKNGTATYRVENGTIVGKTSDGSPNSFLCSEKDYADFDFEFEVKVDNRLNSGVQIRSQTVGGTNEGRVNGPQVEIEAGGADGAEAGYIYGESAGGWMTPEKKLVPHKHFKDGQWNAYRVLAVGPRIRVWINGMLISDLVDMDKFESHRRGFIGLQVHGIGRNEGPYEVAWRNLRLREMDAATSSWKQLYNGKDLDGWQTTGNWKPQADGSLLIQPRAGELGWQRYSDYIWSNRRYSDFVLEVEYKYPAKGNSGVYFRVDDISNPVESGIEAQILDNSEDTRAMTQHDHGGIISTAAPSRNMSKKPGEWNKMVVTCYGSFLQVKLNGEKIIDIELDKSAAKDKPMDGYIGLQDHGRPNNIHFRNIRILEL